MRNLDYTIIVFYVYDVQFKLRIVIHVLREFVTLIPEDSCVPIVTISVNNNVKLPVLV